MNIFFIISIILSCIALYMLLANCFKVPTFKTSKKIKSRATQNKSKSDPFSFVDSFAKPIAQYLPMSLPTQIKLEKMLVYSDKKETPRDFQSRLVVSFLLILIISFPLLFISPWFIIAPIIIGTIVVKKQINNLKKISKNTQIKIENDLPQLVETVAHSFKTNRNIEQILDRYIINHDNFISKELKKTMADMRTGSQEVALQRLEIRINNPLMSQLIRGIMATLHGEDMTYYFDELLLKISSLRKEKLTQKALNTRPKLSKLTTLRAVWCLVVFFSISIIGIYHLAKLGGA